jgi:hypothetical protein
MYDFWSFVSPMPNGMGQPETEVASSYVEAYVRSHIMEHLGFPGLDPRPAHIPDHMVGSYFFLGSWPLTCRRAHIQFFCHKYIFPIQLSCHV